MSVAKGLSFEACLITVRVFKRPELGSWNNDTVTCRAPQWGQVSRPNAPSGNATNRRQQTPPGERQTHERCPTGQNVRAAYCNARRSRADESSNSKYKTAAGDGRHNRDFSKAAPTRHKLTERAPASNRQPDPTDALQCWVTPWAARSSKSARASRDDFFLNRSLRKRSFYSEEQIRQKIRSLGTTPRNNKSGS